MTTIYTKAEVDDLLAAAWAQVQIISAQIDKQFDVLLKSFTARFNELFTACSENKNRINELDQKFKTQSIANEKITLQAERLHRAEKNAH
jgi:hypothetical protein